MEDITPQELRTRIDAGEEIHMIDVREEYEHEEYNIGGTNLPLGDIMTWSEALEVPKDREIVLYCRTGNRSGMAKSVLESKGFFKARNLTGGVVAWQESSD